MQKPIPNSDPARKSNINPLCLQQMLDSAANAADKGQSQFFTPPEFAAKLAVGLPRVRPTLVDLNCGNGQLLQASADAKTTRSLLGADIDPCRCLVESGRSVNKITHDLTKLYPLLKEVGFKADCFVLNPPWRLFWYRDRLAALGDSELSTVRQAFLGTEAGCPKGTIDSTIATLLMALDLGTIYSEGFIEGNNNTFERLIFSPKAPHAAVARHVWLRLVIPGNPMTGINHCDWKKDEQFHTGILFFAREHLHGTKTVLVEPGESWPDLRYSRLHRTGAELQNEHAANQRQHDLWHAAKERVAEIDGASPRVKWNIWLTVNGRIKTALSAFQECSIKVNKQEAARLNALQGKAPMELVLQRNQRDELLHVTENRGTGDFPWRVQPELLAAVKQAILDYHSARAPLYPLSDIQRLGYLDEQDAIICRKDLLHPDGRLAFRGGERYPIRTQTVIVTRTKWKPNSFTGEDEQIELSGQELAIYLRNPDLKPPTDKNSKSKAATETPGTEFCFMDASLKTDKHTRVATAKQVKGTDGADADKIDFTLPQLCEHFIIPDVPDVATANPQAYEANLDILTELETLCP